MKGHLIRIDATTEGADYPLFLASVDVPELCHLDGQAWESNIARLPTLSYDFFGGAFDGQIGAPQMSFTVSVDGIEGFFDRAYADARVRFWEGEVGDPFHLFTLVYDGLIAANPDVRDGIASFTARTDAAWLDVPLLSLYEGTGGVEGDADKTGQVKPLVFGSVRFADAALIDAVNLIYQVHDGAVDDITATYDRVASLGTSSGDYASFSALEAATVPAGGWATCLALGLVRLGAPPDGRVAFDVENGTGLPGAVIEAVAEVAGGEVSLSNLDTECPYALQIQLGGQTTAREVIQSIADSIGAVAGMTWTGDLFVQPLAIDADPVDELDAEGGSDIAVAEVSELTIAAPYWRLATEAERSFVVYALSEVASGYQFRGTYASATEYRVDDVVFAADGRAFAYINATPDSGNAPPALPATSNSYWSLFGGATVGAPAGTSVAGRDAEDVAGTVAAGGGVASTSNVAGRDATDIANTVAAGGGVDVDQVSKTSIKANAVTAPYYVATGSQVMSTSTGRQAITGLSWSANIPIGEGLDVDLNLMPLWSGNDGTRFSMDAYLLRDGVDVETFGQVMDTNDMATNNQGGFAVPVALFTRINGNGTNSTYSVEIEMKASRSESNSGGSKTFSAPLDLTNKEAKLRGRRFSR